MRSFFLHTVQRTIARDRARRTPSATTGQQRDEGIVVEGRDIGSVVLPSADLKVFLTADPAIRALRRAREQSGGEAVAEASITETGEALSKRDAFDSSRAASPMMRAADAVIVDTTEMSLEQVVDHVCGLIQG